MTTIELNGQTYEVNGSEAFVIKTRPNQSRLGTAAGTYRSRITSPRKLKRLIKMAEALGGKNATND